MPAERMFIHFDQSRASESPWVERVWSSHSERAGKFLSIASCHPEIVITRIQGRAIVTVRGPETQPSEVECPADGEWLAIRFKTGCHLPHFPVSRLVNSLGVNLPEVSRRAFLLDGARWEIPLFDNAETFVRRMVAEGLLKRDPEVAAILEDGEPELSTRSMQRHFQRVVGMPHNSVRQIERARRAVNLVRERVPLADVVWRCGYYDHAHLTRSLRRWIGLTPTEVATDIQLSFLYKTGEAALR